MLLITSVPYVTKFRDQKQNGEAEISQIKFANESIRLHNTKMASKSMRKLSSLSHGPCCTQYSAVYARLLFNSFPKKGNVSQLIYSDGKQTALKNVFS